MKKALHDALGYFWVKTLWKPTKKENKKLRARTLGLAGE